LEIQLGMSLEGCFEIQLCTEFMLAQEKCTTMYNIIVLRL